MNGPVPTGLLLYGTRLRSGYCASKCFGYTGYGVELIVKNVFTNGANDCLRWTTSVCWFGVSIDVMRS